MSRNVNAAVHLEKSRARIGCSNIFQESEIGCRKLTIVVQTSRGANITKLSSQIYCLRNFVTDSQIVALIVVTFNQLQNDPKTDNSVSRVMTIDGILFQPPLCLLIMHKRHILIAVSFRFAKQIFLLYVPILMGTSPNLLVTFHHAVSYFCSLFFFNWGLFMFIFAINSTPTLDILVFGILY